MSEQRRRIISNSSSILVNRLAQAIGTFVLTAAIARTLGAQVLGQYLLAVSYYYMFVGIASQGIKTLLTRELSSDLEKIPVYLVSATLLQFFLSVIAYIALVVVVWILPYSPDISTTIYILGLTIIPFSLSNITEAIFQAQERMHLIAISNVPVYVLRLIGMIWAMKLHYGVNYLAGIMILSETLILVIQWLLLIRTIQPKWQIDKGLIVHIISSARTFFAIEATGVVAGRVDIIVISLLGSASMVGIYGGISQLLVPNGIIISSLALAALPRMTKAVEQGLEKQRQTAENLIEFLLFISIPIWIGMCFFGEDLLMLIYRNPDFRGTGTLICILSFLGILSSIRLAFDNLLISNGLQRFNLFEAIITLFVVGISGVILIPQYQLLGAALMRIVGASSACGIIIWAGYSHLFSLRLWKVFSRPILISGLMIPVFIMLQRTDLSLLGILTIATCIYLVFTGCLGIHIFGGPSALFARLFNKTSSY